MRGLGVKLHTTTMHERASSPRRMKASTEFSASLWSIHSKPAGVPHEGQYRECLNTDSHHYGGSNMGTPLGAAWAQHEPSHGKPWSVVLSLPPLATVMLEWKA